MMATDVILNFFATMVCYYGKYRNGHLFINERTGHANFIVEKYDTEGILHMTIENADLPRLVAICDIAGCFRQESNFLLEVNRSNIFDKKLLDDDISGIYVKTACELPNIYIGRNSTLGFSDKMSREQQYGELDMFPLSAFL